MAPSLRQRKRRANGANSSTTAPLVSTANGSVLPDELLYEILLRVPAKPLCRLRTVCRSWRSLLSDSSFVAAHSARHGPLVAAFKQAPEGVDILDISGQTLRRILVDDCPQHQFANVACTNLDLFCLVGEDLLPRILDPATGVVSPLSNDNQKLYYDGHTTSLAFGTAPSTGETKVLAITAKHRKVTSCKVLTFGGAGECWRDTGCPPNLLATSSRCAPLVKGVLYFSAYDNNYRIDHIAAYDLDTEKWRQDLLHLPLPIHEAIPLAELSDTLVAVYRRNNKSYIS
jgi:F-box interacting protein